MSFVYDFYAGRVNAGTTPQPSAWAKYGFALMNDFYGPNQGSDRFISDIVGSGGIADLGDVEPGPLVRTFAGTGLHIALTGGHSSWLAVAAGEPIIAVLLWGQETVNPLSNKVLIAYFDDWGGLGFTPDGTDVTLASLPVNLGTGENVYRISN